MKVMFTSLAGLLYLWMAQLQPFGALVSAKSHDSLDATIRASIGASSGSLAELGVLPILTAGLTMQLLASARFIDVNFSLKEERALFGSTQKCE
jgi:protein transport protein SEC61 subunit alpha